MTTSKNRTASPFGNLLNDLFNEGMNIKETLKREISLPPVNIKEDSQAYMLEMAVPGYTKEDFKLKINEDVLTISVSLEPKTEEETKTEETTKYTRREFSYSNFKRSFALPETADTNKVTAKYEDGILKVDILKKEEEQKVEKSINVL